MGTHPEVLQPRHNYQRSEFES